MSGMSMDIHRISQQRILALLTAISLLCGTPRLAGQPAASSSTIKVLLLRGASSGLSAKETDSFYSRLQGGLAQFTSLSIYGEADLARRLNKDEKIAFAKCSNLNCIQPFARKMGIQRILLCKLAKQNNEYQFLSDEYDVNNSQKLSETTEDADCASAQDVQHFIKRVATKVGQTTTHDTSVPEALQESKSNLWWYIGGAATVGVAAGVYLSVSHKKSSSGSPSSLPLPPDFP
jgi:hypothetical protein